MDRVRFGRALGYGARHAAKTVAKAAAAASAPNPSRETGGAAVRRPSAVSESAAAGPTVQERAAQAGRNVRVASQQARQASGAILQPVKRFSRAVGLQVAGGFFALIALAMATGAWKVRDALHKSATSHDAIRLYVYLGVGALFAYFAVSSFVRAERR